jgi:hypothetical protein
MEIATLKNIFNFIEVNEKKLSIKWKMMNKIPFTKEQLYVKGDLDLQGEDIEQLPAGLYVKRNLLLNATPIKKLPKGLRVGGDLQLQDCENLKSLPKDLKVRGNIWLGGTPLGRMSDEKILNMVKPDGYIGNIY